MRTSRRTTRSFQASRAGPSIAARGPLVEALKRISLVANDKSGGVQLMIEPGMLRLQSQNPEVGEGSEDVDVDYAGDELRRLGSTPGILLDALSASAA